MTPTITQMAMSAETSVGMSVVIGPSWKLSGTDLTMPLMSPPKKNWNVYCNAMDRPMVTIICCMVPTWRLRSGPQTISFWMKPVSAPMTMAKMAEAMSGMCSICVSTYAMRPPSVTCSPCENDCRPVVP